MPTNPSDPKVALADKRAVLEAMPADQVKTPVYPPHHLVGEANALYEVGNRYRTALAAVNLDLSLIDDLPVRAQALAGAQAARALVPDTKRTAEEVAAEDDAAKARDDVYAAGRYATRGIAEAQSALDKISEGTGYDDLIQDLKDLGFFTEKYSKEMTAIGVNVPEESKRLLGLARKFEKILAERRALTAAEQASTDLRNRAATHLFGAMATIRAAGTYAFRNDPRVLPLFRSAYRRRRRTGAGGTAEDTPSDS